jgi:hypothetical protein
VELRAGKSSWQGSLHMWWLLCHHLSHTPSPLNRTLNLPYSDPFPVFFEVISDVRREIPIHIVFHFKNVNWSRFRQVLDS